MNNVLKKITSFSVFSVLMVTLAILTSFFTSYLFHFINFRNQVSSFVNKGPRFTANDGQELCLRVKALEESSYILRDSGQIPQECNYLKNKD